MTSRSVGRIVATDIVVMIVAFGLISPIDGTRLPPVACSKTRARATVCKPSCKYCQWYLPFDITSKGKNKAVLDILEVIGPWRL
jgi:hypothetical protein